MEDGFPGDSVRQVLPKRNHAPVTNIAASDYVPCQVHDIANFDVLQILIGNWRMEHLLHSDTPRCESNS